MAETDETASVNATAVFEKAVSKVLGLAVYEDILAKVRATQDLSKDEKFKREFVWFYKLRHGKEWNEAFFLVFEAMRRKHDIQEVEITFREILLALNAITGCNRIDISFASKMLATLDTSKPIYDQFVAKNLMLGPLPATTLPLDERVDMACSNYDTLVEKSEKLLRNWKVQQELRVFDEVLPTYSWLSPMKKLDFLLWANQDGE